MNNPKYLLIEDTCIFRALFSYHPSTLCWSGATGESFYNLCLNSFVRPNSSFCCLCMYVCMYAWKWTTTTYTHVSRSLFNANTIKQGRGLFLLCARIFFCLRLARLRVSSYSNAALCKIAPRRQLIAQSWFGFDAFTSIFMKRIWETRKFGNCLNETTRPFFRRM